MLPAIESLRLGLAGAHHGGDAPMNRLPAAIAVMAIALVFCTSVIVIAFTDLYWFYIVVGGTAIINLVVVIYTHDAAVPDGQASPITRGPPPRSLD